MLIGGRNHLYDIHETSRCPRKWFQNINILLAYSFQNSFKIIQLFGSRKISKAESDLRINAIFYMVENGTQLTITDYNSTPNIDPVIQ